jgi:signal recognition particle subunit SRP54
MMNQAARIKAATNPDETLFVVDAMIGQDAVNTALAFERGVGIDGVVLAKMDGDARGGAALSITHVIGKPIMFTSSGEGLGDFDVFHPDRMASRILGMGDMLTLIEQAEKAFDQEQARIAAEKLLSAQNKYTLQDFLSQMQQMRKIGPMSKIMGMLPGMGQLREAIENFDEREVDRVEAIIYSMTPAERAEVEILNGSRRLRIAKGSGTTVQQVNELVKRFVAARKMMGQMGGMIGQATKAAAKGSSKQQSKKKGGKISGNPAKRAALAAAKAANAQPGAATVAAEGTPALPVSPFGFDAADFESPELLADLSQTTKFDLPPALRQALDQQNQRPRR